MQNRVTYENGEIDEIVTNGGAHLERMDTDEWFLECVRSDGSSVAVWIIGTVWRVEEREARKKMKMDILEKVESQIGDEVRVILDRDALFKEVVAEITRLRALVEELKADRIRINDEAETEIKRLQLKNKKQSKEITLLREALRRYGDKSRMGTVESMELQQAIDRALEGGE